MSGDRQVGSRVICYSDGWCEQGGYITTTNYSTVTLLKRMKNTSYTITIGCARNSGTTCSGQQNDQVFKASNTQTSFYIYVNDTSGNSDYWRVSGMAYGY